MSFSQWLIENKNLSEATAQKYDLVIRNRIKEWLPSYELPQNYIDYEVLKRDIEDLDIYKERNSVGNNMYSAALKHYGNFLKEKQSNIDEIFDLKNNFNVEAERMINVRLQQHRFRRKLFLIHDHCIITGYSKNNLLIASHIKPWSKSTDDEKIDPYNGLLLTPNFDKLFDKNLISIDFHGNIILSRELNSIDIEFFKIPKKIDFKFNNQHRKYLEYHNALVEQ